MTALAVDALAAFRLTRLVTTDTILDGPRGRVLDALDDRGPRAARVADGLTCSWCVGVWAAGAVLMLRQVSPKVGGALVDLLAVAAGAGLVAEWGQR